jgi:serine/threonine protein phosphatase 1
MVLRSARSGVLRIRLTFDPMFGRILAIGDIRGCNAALAAFLQTVAPKADDTFVTLGDYVDRGPD